MADNTPTTLNCPSCGAPLEFDGRSSVVRCRFCKNIALVPGLPAEKEATPRASLDEVRRLAQNGNLIEAVRRYRELYGVGLKEAKNAVDALTAGKVVEVHRVFSGPLTSEETSRVLEEVKELLRSGNKVGALKHYREVNDVSLNKAMDVVNQVEAALTGVPVPPRPEILGSPSSTLRPARVRLLATIFTLLTILVVTGAFLAIVLLKRGNLFVPNLYAGDPAILVPSGIGASPDLAALFYNPISEKRQVGLLDGSTGSLRWQAEPLTGDGFIQAISSGGSLVYAANGSTLLAYQKSDGSLAWQTQMPDKLNYSDSTLLVTAGRVITLNADQSLQAYDAATGRLVWDRRLAGYDRTLRLLNGLLVVMDYTDNNYTYSLFFIDPLDGTLLRTVTPTCQTDQNSSATLDTDSGLLYSEAENALFLVYDSSYGCVQRLDFATGAMTWQSLSGDSFSSSPYGFNLLMTAATLYFNDGGQLLAVDKHIGTIQTLVSNEDYDFVPLAVTGDTLLLRARRTRGTERFELWGVNAATGRQLWQMSIQGAEPVDPPDEMIGLVDDTDSGWTWRLLPPGLVLIKFQAAPNQLVLGTYNPADGTLLNEQKVPLPQVTGDFYSVPRVIGWLDNLAYLNIDSTIFALDVSTGKVVFHF